MWIAVAAVAILALAAPWATPGLLLGDSEAGISAYLSPPLDGAAGCFEPPLCRSPRLTWRGRLSCSLGGAAPLAPDSAAYIEYATQRLRATLPRAVLGQYSLGPILAAVERKLRHPGELLVMHFAGDNGVGKTRAAELISLALATGCGDADCTRGASTLALTGTAYDGVSLGDYRRSVVTAIVAHARRHRRSGVLVINELSSLEPDKVRLLLPVLGRGGSFPEAPEVDLAALTVIVTTDFGREGRTRGRSVDEMRAFINAEFQELYSRASTSNIRSFPFLPISLQTAKEVAYASALRLGCEVCGRPAHLTEDAALLLLERAKPGLAAENGRAVNEMVMDGIEGLVDGLCGRGGPAATGETGHRIVVGVADDGGLDAFLAHD